ncbi:uncharacterized protein LOC113320918 isoform X3 [Papaver somniferum]|nr:uncharacterized protein LOC113320918 isoform X3 [Papaver somniferum]XP_026424607.1 uncharacterized protein LOC113320918 isoform X3 [Papaver somniferum]
MRWHHEGRTKDGVLRHPADSEAWRHFDEMNPTFKADPRNIRLGPHSPGNDIDVYLRPLIDELKELWEEGVDTYDSSRNEMFNLKAGLLWTISGYPGLAMLSGWSNKGKLACSTCLEETRHQWLNNRRKTVYMGHRRFLPMNHRMPKGGAALRFLHDLLPNQRLAVEVDMEHLCPLGENGTYITKYITHLASDGHKLALTIHDWKYMPSHLVENVVLEIKQIFKYPEVLDDWIYSKINDRCKDHKYHVKKNAYKNGIRWKNVLLIHHTMLLRASGGYSLRFGILIWRNKKYAKKTRKTGRNKNLAILWALNLMLSVPQSWERN